MIMSTLSTSKTVTSISEFVKQVNCDQFVGCASLIIIITYTVSGTDKVSIRLPNLQSVSLLITFFGFHNFLS